MINHENNISLMQLSEELGYSRGKQAMIKDAELWCDKPHESAAFHPDQKVTQGQIKTANELLEYLKK